MSNNTFTISYLKEILLAARAGGYHFMTMRQYVEKGCPKEEKIFVFRLDLDLKPQMMRPISSLLKELSVPATMFVRVAGPYNIFWYPHYQAIKEAADAGVEIGLHTTPVEWAQINDKETETVFAAELSALRSLFPLVGVAPHRDVNYVHNSLPWLDENFEDVKEKYGILYHAYEKRILGDMLYINEGLSPHLGWRHMTPHEAVATGKPICMLLHPHWWFVNNPFESD